MELLISLAISGLCGYLAGKMMNMSGAWWVYILLGLAGGAVGNFVFNLAGFAITSSLGGVIASVVGAMIVIFVYRQFFAK